MLSTSDSPARVVPSAEQAELLEQAVVDEELEQE